MSRLAEPRIVLCYPVEPRHLEQIQAVIPEAVVVDAGQERIARELLEADIFCGHAKVPVPWDQVVQQGRLKWIQSSAAGLDHCLVQSVIDSPIVVSSSSGLFADQVAEQTLCLLLGQLRRLPDFLRAQQAKRFERRPTDDLHGKTVGIVGFGGNGRRVAEVLSTFKVHLVATDVFPLRKPPYVEQLWGADEIGRLLSVAEIVILCVPLNAQTNGWFDATRLRQMRRGSYLVNVARGPVVVEKDLVAALRDGHLAGAALDVTEVEPLPPQSELWEMPQVVITPHVGAQAADRVDVSTDFFCDNLRRYFNGQRLLNRIDKQLGFPRPEDHVGLPRPMTGRDVPPVQP
jgi:phosphoglycerate dehydrogenase-like enzyme